MDPVLNPGLQEGSARSVYLPAMVAAIGGLLFGFDTAVINGAIVFIKQQFGLSDSQTEIAAIAAAVFQMLDSRTVNPAATVVSSEASAWKKSSRTEGLR